MRTTSRVWLAERVPSRQRISDVTQFTYAVTSNKPRLGFGFSSRACCQRSSLPNLQENTSATDLCTSGFPFMRPAKGYASVESILNEINSFIFTNYNIQTPALYSSFNTKDNLGCKFLKCKKVSRARLVIRRSENFEQRA